METITADNKTPSALLRLPGEIRNRIYEYAFCVEHIDGQWCTSSSGVPSFSLCATIGDNMTSISAVLEPLQTCRQFYHEAALLPFVVNDFQVNGAHMEYMISALPLRVRRVIETLRLEDDGICEQGYHRRGEPRLRKRMHDPETIRLVWWKELPALKRVEMVAPFVDEPRSLAREMDYDGLRESKLLRRRTFGFWRGWLGLVQLSCPAKHRQQLSLKTTLTDSSCGYSIIAMTHDSTASLLSDLTSIALRNEQMSPLLHLPSELRNAIFEYTLTAGCITVDVGTKFYTAATRHVRFQVEYDLWVDQLCTGRFTALLCPTQVCRQLRLEYRPLVYALNTFIVKLVDLEDFVEVLPYHAKGMVSTIKIPIIEHNYMGAGSWEVANFAALRHLQSLEKVVIERTSPIGCICGVCCEKDKIQAARLIKHHAGVDLDVQIVTKGEQTKQCEGSRL
ncbi:hypothetical protein EK21DRAFT_85595 [Setomelanomma holmii]|uniref:Uncharacterized protein n=1 Tax=Setomelanomma holmii TaxID=210430 RepID=A0A9P4HJI4_9PLEO|nr:hypothetical protein EK21DRAFT_85595 [Setomelanomma holmii]